MCIDLHAVSFQQLLLHVSDVCITCVCAGDALHSTPFSGGYFVYVTSQRNMPYTYVYRVSGGWVGVGRDPGWVEEGGGAQPTVVRSSFTQGRFERSTFRQGILTLSPCHGGSIYVCLRLSDI